MREMWSVHKIFHLMRYADITEFSLRAHKDWRNKFVLENYGWTNRKSGPCSMRNKKHFQDIEYRHCLATGTVRIKQVTKILGIYYNIVYTAHIYFRRIPFWYGFILVPILSNVQDYTHLGTYIPTLPPSQHAIYDE